MRLRLFRPRFHRATLRPVREEVWNASITSTTCTARSPLSRCWPFARLHGEREVGQARAAANAGHYGSAESVTHSRLVGRPEFHLTAERVWGRARRASPRFREFRSAACWLAQISKLIVTVAMAPSCHFQFAGCRWVGTSTLIFFAEIDLVRDRTLLERCLGQRRRRFFTGPISSTSDVR